MTKNGFEDPKVCCDPPVQRQMFRALGGDTQNFLRKFVRFFYNSQMLLKQNRSFTNFTVDNINL